MAALTVHGHLTLSEKLPKWHFLICAWNLKKKLGQITSFDFYDSYEFLAMLEGKIREAPFF